MGEMLYYPNEATEPFKGEYDKNPEAYEDFADFPMGRPGRLLLDFRFPWGSASRLFVDAYHTAVACSATQTS